MSTMEESAAAKLAKETKAKKAASAPRKRNPSAHPSYEEMIKDAVVTLKERTGSSQYAIQKFIEGKHKQLPPTFRKLVLLSLKRLVATGKLVKVKGSFKLPSAKSSQPKPAATSLVDKKKKPAASGVSKSKSKAVAKPSISKGSKKPAVSAAAAKTKPKSAAKAAKPKPKSGVKTKAVSAKPKAKERPTKVARTSTRTSPAKKPAAPKKATAAKTTPKAVKSPAKKVSKRGKK